MSSKSATVFKEFRLYCAHSVASLGKGNKCSRIHGHTYKVRVEVTRPIDESTGIAIPFEEIESAWESTAGKLDHTNLNETLGENATTEILAHWIKGAIEKKLNQHTSIEVRETETAGVILR